MNPSLDSDVVSWSNMKRKTEDYRMCLVCDRIGLIKEGKNPYFVKELETGYVVLGDHSRTLMDGTPRKMICPGTTEKQFCAI